jgi:hypothetical protein
MMRDYITFEITNPSGRVYDKDVDLPAEWDEMTGQQRGDWIRATTAQMNIINDAEYLRGGGM